MEESDIFNSAPSETTTLPPSCMLAHLEMLELIRCRTVFGPDTFRGPLLVGRLCVQTRLTDCRVSPVHPCLLSHVIPPDCLKIVGNPLASPLACPEMVKDCLTLNSSDKEGSLSALTITTKSSCA